MKKSKPSDFLTHPWDCAIKLQAHECELIARNIMAILSRTGDKFRKLTWDQYKEERKMDGDFSEQEQLFFVNVIDYCKSPATAKLFSKSWAS